MTSGGLDQYLDDVAPSVSHVVSPADHMVPPSGDLSGYLAVGRDALRVIALGLMAAKADVPGRVLDFGCGGGRVTRWLRAAYPGATIVGSDLRSDALAFVGTEFNVEALASSENIDALEIGGSYDLIWLGSVFTHLDEGQTRTLLEKLFAALASDGILIFTTHGRRMLHNQLAGLPHYIAEDRFAAIVSRAMATGFGFNSHVEGAYGGISLTDPAWLTRWCCESTERRLVSITEKGWADHQDVVVVARQPI